MAAIFALLCVGGGIFIHYSAGKTKGAATPPATSPVSSWQGIASTSTAPAPTLSQTLSGNLYAQYMNLAGQGTFTAAERDQMLASLAKNNVTEPAIVPDIGLGDLSIVATTSLDSYMQLLAVVLAQGGQVKEYELNVFARTLQNQVTSGTPELAADADLYQRIAAAALVMDVPASVAPQHLEIVKSVGALSKAVSLLATWNGDPIEGLTYVDAFNKAQAYVTNSVNALLAAVQKLQKA